MDVARFLARTRFIRSDFPDESRYRFSAEANDLISRFCAAHSLPRADIAFHPAYTSRASPELIRLGSRRHIIWDYHFVELVTSFNLVTLSAALLDGRDATVTASLPRDSLRNHFLASLFKYLSCQLFRRPHLSLALADAFAQLAGPLRTPVPSEDADRLAELEVFQWVYVLHHELVHVYFATVPEADRRQEFDWLAGAFRTMSDVHRLVREHGTAAPLNHGGLDLYWLSREDYEPYESMLTSYSEQMLRAFDKRIAEEILCDMLALRVTAIASCIGAGAPFRFDDDSCVYALEFSRSAANSINSFRQLLEYLRVFWQRLAQSDERVGLTRSAIEKERQAAATMIQEVFLRGSIGLEAAWYGSVASALGQRELRLDDPHLLAHVEKSMVERQDGLGVEGFDEMLTRAWSSLKDSAHTCVDTEVVEVIFNQSRETAAKLNPAQALEEACSAIGW
jgi:hypothetical protein